MGDILLILSLLYALKSLLTTSLLPNKWIVLGFALACAGFVWLSHGYALDQNKLALETVMEGQGILTDVSLVVMVDLMLTVAFGQSALNRSAGVAQNRFRRMMGYIPPVLLLPVLYYVQVNSFFYFTGVDFMLITGVLSAFALVFVAGGTAIVRRLLPDADLRIELTALVELLIFVLVISCTIFHPAAMIFMDNSPPDYLNLLLTVAVALVFFAAGFAWHKVKVYIKRGKTNKTQ